MTIVLLTCSYREREFLRVGYYVNNEYNVPELQENPPSIPEVEKIVRSIVGDEPRVTKFQHKFDFGDPNEELASDKAEKQAQRASLMEGARRAKDNDAFQNGIAN